MMASYVTNISPAGNYVFINGPVEDNNSLLIEKGVMNVLKPLIEKKKINDLYQDNASEWIELSGYLIMTDYFQDHSENITL
jgi:ABC-type xylose transport system substrate-binding protein